MRTKEAFSLTKRKTKDGFVWQYLTYDRQGRRRRFSTGCTTKTQALDYVLGLAKKGALVPEEGKKEPDAVTFGDFAKDWWTKDCDYVKAEALRGKKLGGQYVHTNRQLLGKHILPTFRRCPVGAITPYMIETWLERLVDRKRLSNKSADNILSILSVMLEEARRQGLAKTNPCREVRPFAKDMKVRGIFTIDEARRLLTTPSLWDNPVAYAASLLAACTGMRLGEVRALRACDIRDGYIHVEHSVDLHGNLKSTKTGDVRDLPLPPRIMGELLDLKKHVGPEEKLFSVAGKPVSSELIRDGLYRAMARMGVTEEERRKRNITFHSWRHFLNSQLLSHGINESKTRKITGHSTESMTEHYTHFLVKDFEDVLQITEDIVKEQKL